MQGSAVSPCPCPVHGRFPHRRATRVSRARDITFDPGSCRRRRGCRSHECAANGPPPERPRCLHFFGPPDLPVREFVIERCTNGLHAHFDGPERAGTGVEIGPGLRTLSLAPAATGPDVNHADGDGNAPPVITTARSRSPDHRSLWEPGDGTALVFPPPSPTGSPTGGREPPKCIRQPGCYAQTPPSLKPRTPYHETVSVAIPEHKAIISLVIDYDLFT